MYYTETDPRTGEKVYVPKTPHEKAMQRALMQYRNPANFDLVMEALQKAHRVDLIGFDAKCLIRPRKMAAEKKTEVVTGRPVNKRRSINSDSRKSAAKGRHSSKKK